MPLPFLSVADATANVTGATHDLEDVCSRHQIVLVATAFTGPGDIFAYIDVSPDGVSWLQLGSPTSNLQGAGVVASSIFTSLARYVRARVEFEGGATGTASAWVISAP